MMRVMNTYEMFAEWFPECVRYEPKYGETII
jgi:hypothetical protein